MSQHDMTVDNGAGLAVRTDINNALKALASQSSGASAPSPTFPCQEWADTGTGRLKRRDSANTVWLDAGILDSQGDVSTLASATVTDIGASPSPLIYISGTTTITNLGTVAANVRRTVRFIASLTLTYNATSLILPGGASITTAANDSAEFVSLGSGNWLCLDYMRSNGKPVAFAYDRSTILGTVSQSSGVPTGSIIERGSNANGSYVKFADGTMYCALLNQPLSFNNTSNIGFTWTYPQSFAAIEFVGVNAIGTLGVSRVINSISAYARTNTQATVGALSVAAFLAGDQAVLNFDVFAIGRWF